MRIDRSIGIKLSAFAGLAAVATAGHHLGLGNEVAGMLPLAFGLAGHAAETLFGHVGTELIVAAADKSAGRAAAKARGKQNRDVHRLIGHAIASILEEAAKEAPNANHGTKYLNAAAAAFRNKEWMTVELDPAEAAIGEVEAVKFFTGDPEKIKKDPVLSGKQWSALVEKVAGKIPSPGSDVLPLQSDQGTMRTLEFAAVKLRDGFAFALWEAAKKAWEKKDLAWPALVLRLLSNILGYSSGAAASSDALAGQVKKLSNQIEALGIAVYKEGKDRAEQIDSPSSNDANLMLSAMHEHWGEITTGLKDLRTQLERIDRTLSRINPVVVATQETVVEARDFAQSAAITSQTALREVVAMRTAISNWTGVHVRVEGEPWIRQFLTESYRDYMEWKQSALLRGYTEVLVNPDRIFLAPGEQDLISGKGKFEKYSIRKAVREFSPLVVVGDPGVGKTTALREISLRYLEEYLPDQLLPLYVPITQVTTHASQSLGIAEELLKATLKRLYPTWDFDSSQLWQMLERYPSVLLFDGLNEISESLISSYCDSIRAFAEQLHRLQGESRIVIASRFDNLSRHKDSARRITPYIFEVQKLTDEQRITEFVGNYIPDCKKRDIFISLLQQKESARRMAQNALMLTGMIMVYEQDESLPDSRAKLLERMATVLLARSAELDDSYGKERTELRHKLLMCFAFELRKRRRGLGTSLGEAESIIETAIRESISNIPNASRVIGTGDVQALIDEFVVKRILARVHPGLKFWLESIQEYFAGCAVARDLQVGFGYLGGSRERVVSARANVDELVSDMDWHQILALAVGLSDTPTAMNFLKHVESRFPLLAAVSFANQPLLPADFFINNLRRRISRIVQFGVLSTWINLTVSAATLFFVGWALLSVFAYVQFATVRVRELTGLPTGLLVSAYLTFVILVALLIPTYWFSALDRFEQWLLNIILPQRYIQPLLRSLVIVNTPTAIRALSNMDSLCQSKKDLSPTIKLYVGLANKVWRFQQERVDDLLMMLNDPVGADYAIDRLGQMGEPQAIKPLVNIAWLQPIPRSENAIRALARIAREVDEVEEADIKAALRALLERSERLAYSTRLAAYLALVTLGEPDQTIRRPHRFDTLATALKLHPMQRRRILIFMLITAITLIGIWRFLASTN